MTPRRSILSLLLALAAVTAAAPAQAQLLYGHAYSLQNGYNNWSGGYLDTRNSGCQNNKLCVSTAYTPERDRNSGWWVITSAEGKLHGAPVMAGDKVYLKNLWNNGSGGYLDTKESGCQGDDLCVSTSGTKTRDGGSGTWKIMTDDPNLSGALFEGQALHLLNQWAGNGGYLDTDGNGCQGNDLCVATSATFDRASGSTHWRFVEVTSEHRASRSDTFCYDSTRSITLLQNDVASLSWNVYGNLTLVNTGNGTLGAQAIHKWGINSATPLTDPNSNTATLCFDGAGNFTITNHAGQVTWQSSTAATTGNQLVLDRCTVSTMSDAGGKWSASTAACIYPSTKRGWCKARPTVSDTTIIWNDGVELDWQVDGNLVSYLNSDNRSVVNFVSGTNGKGQNLCLQNDGNFVIYDGSGAAVWASGSGGATDLNIETCGVSTSYYNSSFQLMENWRAGSGFCSAVEMGHAGGGGWCRMRGAASRLLDNGMGHLEWQGDGNLVLYRSSDGKAIADSHTGGANVSDASTGYVVCFDGKGNLYVDNKAGSTLWNANSAGGNRLMLSGCTASVSNTGTGAVEWSQWSWNPCMAPVAGGGFSFVYDKASGDSDFGAEMWVLGGATNYNAITNFRASLPGGSAAAAAADRLLPPTSGLPTSYAEALGDAGVSATLFSKNWTVLEVGGYIGDDNGTIDDLGLTVMGVSVFNGAITTYTWSVDKAFYEVDRDFLLGGVVPVTVHADVTGTLSLSADFSANLGTSQLTFDATPSANLGVNASAGVGVSGFSAGVKGSLTLINIGVPFTLHYTPTNRQYDAHSHITLSTLDGELDLYADATIASYSKRLTRWSGYSWNWSLFDTSGSL